MVEDADRRRVGGDFRRQRLGGVAVLLRLALGDLGDDHLDQGVGDLGALLIHLVLQSHRPARMDKVAVILDDNRQLRRPVTEYALGPASRNRFMQVHLQQVFGRPFLILRGDQVIQQDGFGDAAGQDVDRLPCPAFQAAD